jgi:hypothetical protein
VPDCRVKTLAADELPAERYEQIATAQYGSTFSWASCSRKKIHAAMRADACRVGANAVVVTHEELPDWWSGCHRAEAKLVRLKP